MNTIGFTKLLEGKVNRVYADFVPEKKTLPAVAYSHLSNGGSRLLKGSRTGLFDTWRVMIVCKTRTECDALLLTLSELDNTKSADFMNVFVIADGGIQAQPEDKTRTAFIDIKTYD